MPQPDTTTAAAPVPPSAPARARIPVLAQVGSAIPRWAWEALAVVALVLVPELFVMALGNTVLVGDSVTSNLPLKKLAMDQLLAGNAPLWTPLVGNGIPLLADNISLPFDPRNVFFAALSPVDAYVATLLASRIAGAIVTFFYLRRRHGLGFAAAFAGTAVFFFGTLFWEESRLHSTAPALDLFPAVVWVAELLLERVTVRRVAGLALLWALLFQMASIAYLAYVPFLAGAWILTLWLAGAAGRDRRALGRWALAFVGSGVWGLVLSAITLLPFLELIGQSNRGAEYLTDPFLARSAFYAVVGVWGSYTAFVPGYESFFYVGIVALPFLALALGRRDNPWLRGVPWLAAATLVVTGILMTPVKRAVAAVLPPITSIPTFRLDFFWGFCAAVLVAYGVQHAAWKLGRRPALFARFVELVQICLVGGIVLLLGAFLVLRLEDVAAWVEVYDGILVPFIGTVTVGVVLLLLIRLAGVLAARRALEHRGPRRLVGVELRTLAVVALVAELVVAWLAVRPVVKASDPYPRTSQVAFLQAHQGSERMLNLLPQQALGPELMQRPQDRRPLFMDAPAVNGVRTSSVYESLVDRDFSRVFDDLGDKAARRKAYPRAPNAIMVTTAAGSPLLNVLGVHYLLSSQPLPPSPAYHQVVAGGGFDIYERNDYAPRAYLVGRGVTVPADAVHQRLQQIAAGKRDPDELKRNVLLTGRTPAVQGSGQPASLVGVPATDEGSERTTVRFHATAPAFLVLTDDDYPGWKAELDGGKRLPIREANGFARAVAVPAGDHTVTFVYDPASYRVGTDITLVALALTGMLLIAPPLLRRARGRSG